MSDKVDYSKITVNFNDLMMKMHQQAAEKVPQNFDIVNLPTKDNNVFVIIAKTKDGSEPNKKDCLDVIKQYISVYVGEDAAKMVSQKNMQPIFAEPQKKDNQEQPNNNKEEEKTPGPENKSDQQQVQKESFYMSRKYRKIFESVDFLFEAEPSTPDPSSPTPSPDPSPEPKPEPGKDEPPTPTGYSVTYNFDINGPDAGRGFRKRMMGIMSGSLADLMNMEIQTFGGRTIKVGSVFDPQQWKANVFGRPDINKDTVDNNLQAIFHEDFTQSSVQTAVQDVTSLSELIVKQTLSPENVEIGTNGRMDGSEQEIKQEIINRLKKAKYAVTILVEKRDPAYKHFTRELIAWYCTKAFGTSLTVRNNNKVNLGDVIRINGWQDVQKRRSSFDVARTNPKNSAVATSVSAKESQMFILRGDIVESIMNELFGNVVTEELITEGHADEYNLCKEKLQKIGIENLKANLPKFREEYSKAANKCQIRKTVKGKKGSETTIVTGVQVPTEFKGKTENSKAYEDLLKKSYMKGSSDDNPFMKMVVSKWTNCNTIDEAIKAFDSYITENGSKRVDYSNERTIECWMALEALKTLPEKEEKSNKIKIRFVPHNPMEDKDDEKEALEIEVVPGNIDTEGNEDLKLIKEVYDKDNFHFKNFEPDPNTLKEDGTVVVFYEKTNESDGQIEITFVKKDPSNPSSEEEEVKKLKAKPHEFDKIKDQYPTEDEVKYDNYKFTGWDPDPNEQDKDAKVLAKYEALDNQITITFVKKDPSNKTAKEEPVKELKGTPGKFNEDQYPKEEEVHYDKFQFNGWNPDPNVLSADGNVSATYTAADIAVIFSSKDPTNKKAMEKTVFKMYIGKDRLGKIDTKQAEEKLTKPDGYKFVEWEPNPNEYDEDHIPSDKAIRTSAQWAPESDEISVMFKYKNPADDKSPEKTAEVVKYDKDGFETVQDEDISAAIQKLPSYEGYKFGNWSPDPKEYDNTNIPDNGIITTIAQWSKSEEAGLLSIRFTYKDPTKENALPKTLSTYVTSEDEFGRIDDQGVANLLPKFDGFDFQFWDPDPNEYTKDTFPDSGVATVQAKFQKQGAENSDNQWDIFIIPDKRISSSARPPDETKYGDGTVQSKASNKQREQRQINV